MKDRTVLLQSTSHFSFRLLMLQYLESCNHGFESNSGCWCIAHVYAKNIFLHSLLLCLYFIHTWFFVLIVLHFDFLSLLTTQMSMPLEEFEPAIPASEQPQTFPLDISVTGIG
jgi:hypothetical protein